MAILQHKHAGMVLAAGASSRMGRPKALLPCSERKPLALVQAELLSRSGARDIIIVLGKDAEKIAEDLGSSPWFYCFNPNWSSGRLSSLQAGIRVLPTSTHGVIILPVDTVGVKTETLMEILVMADQSSALAIRPYCQQQPGHVLWISYALFEDILAIPSNPSFRFDHWIESRETRIDVMDSAILNNINTPDDWRTLASKS